MSSCVFAVRSGSTNAWYSTGGSAGMPALGAGTTITVGSNVTTLGGSAIAFSDANNTQKFLTWPARGNTPAVRSLSVMMRHQASYAGAPATRRSILPSLSNGRGASVEVAHDAGSGNIVFSLSSESGASLQTNTIVGLWSPVGSNSYDVTMTWDFSNASSSITVFVNTSTIGTGSPAGVFVAGSSGGVTNLFSEIQLGGGRLSNGIFRGPLEEIAIFDYAIDVTSAPLVGGNGPLNGAARTQFINVPAFDGAVYTNPVNSNVKSGTPYIFAGSSDVGTLAASSGGGSFVFVG